jgi:hypothetical protein
MSAQAKRFTDLSLKIDSNASKTSPQHPLKFMILHGLDENYLCTCSQILKVLDVAIVPTSSVVSLWCLHSVHLERQGKKRQESIAYVLRVTA